MLVAAATAVHQARLAENAAVFITLLTIMSVAVMAQKNQTYLTLNNGVQMPQFGLEVYSISGGDETYNSVMTALKCGYRHIDTAQAAVEE